MNIDIFTFLAQIINFLVFLFILNKLVYKPIMKAMKERNNQIKTTIDDADNKLKEAEDLRTKYNEELRNIENYKEEQTEIINSELADYATTTTVNGIETRLQTVETELNGAVETTNNILLMI